MAKVAVVAHALKSLGGLRELRELLAREGVTDPLWYEVHKSRKAPKYARRAAAEGDRPDVHLGRRQGRCFGSPLAAFGIFIADAGFSLFESLLALGHMTPPSLSLREATAATRGPARSTAARG